MSARRLSVAELPGTEPQPSAGRGAVNMGPVSSRLLLLLVGSPLVLLPAQVGQARSGKALEIKILSVVQTVAQTDVEPKGLSVGDRITMTDRLYNLVPQFGRPKGALVGRDSGTVTVRQGSADFRGTARLPGGTILVRRRFPVASALSRVTVVGGTGRFSNARGTVSIRALGAKGRATNVFHLTLP